MKWRSLSPLCFYLVKHGNQGVGYRYWSYGGISKMTSGIYAQKHLMLASSKGLQWHLPKYVQKEICQPVFLRSPWNCSDQTDGPKWMPLIDYKYWDLERCLWEIGLVLGDQKILLALRGACLGCHCPTSTVCSSRILSFDDLHDSIKVSLNMNFRNQDDGAKQSQGTCDNLLWHC